MSSVIPPRIHAFTITSDPQYIVINFASINELDWAAPDAVWEIDIKPYILNDIGEMTSVLPNGTTGRRLAWSTLMEYMNFPLDQTGPESPYVIKLRRVLEITEKLDLPVFIPLNGFQWWDELPELYNWWDQDGTNTPSQFFARQKTKDFKERFIQGFNPENKWNVEWQDNETPMRYNWRNWGGGGFVLAPPPNIIPHDRTALTYRTVLEQRLNAILRELAIVLTRWEKAGKQHLFAGLSIGTEISLNASVTPEYDFMPYGYRSIQEFICPSQDPICATKLNLSADDLHNLRERIVHAYFLDLTKITAAEGIPKQRIYTHVWETTPEQKRFSKYTASAFNLYSRPGMSFYGFAQDPLSHPQWYKELENHGFHG